MTFQEYERNLAYFPMVFKNHFFPLLVLFSTLGLLMLWGFLHAWYMQENKLMSFSWIVNSDWMMHMTQVQNFSALPLGYVSLHHPLYSGEVLSYPFFVNWFSGILLSLSQDIVFSMVMPMIVGMIFFLGMVYFLLFTITKNQWTAVIALFIFFFSAGFQFVYIWGTNWTELPDYVFDKNLVELGFHWKSVFLTTLLPQRSFVWGMAVGSLAFGLFLHRFFVVLQTPLSEGFFQKYSFQVLRPFFFIGLLTGLVSVLHTHSFLFLFLLFIGFLLFYFRYFLVFFAVALGSFLTSFPFIWVLLQKSSDVSELSLYPLKMSHHYAGDFLSAFFSFWNANWGISFWVLFLFLLPLVWRHVFADFSAFRLRLLQVLFFIVSVLFIAFSIVQMQPNPWDNTKLWLWCSLFFSAFFARLLLWCWNKHVLGKIAAVFIFAISIFSGVLMLWSGINDDNTVVFTQKDLQIAREVKKIIPPNDIVLTSDYFHLPFTVLVPKQSFLGYRGWIASYGMETSKKVRIMKAIYSGSPDAIALLHQENISWVLLDNTVRSEFVVNDDFFETNLEPVANIESWGKLYRVRAD